MEDTLTELYCVVDDFCLLFLPEWHEHLIENGLRKRIKICKLKTSEVITILIHFHQMRFRDFKTYYKKYVKIHLKHLFTNLVSYSRFLELKNENLIPLCMFTQSLSGEHTGIYFVDSLLLKSCHIKREKQHKVFKGLAKKSHSTVGWFFGFKLHLVINDKGEFMAFKVTAANVDDRKPVPDLTKKLVGKLIGDKGYLSSNLFNELYDRGLHLLTKIKNNMKNKLMPII